MVRFCNCGKQLSLDGNHSTTRCQSCTRTAHYHKIKVEIATKIIPELSTLIYKIKNLQVFVGSPVREIERLEQEVAEISESLMVELFDAQSKYRLRPTSTY